MPQIDDPYRLIYHGHFEAAWHNVEFATLFEAMLSLLGALLSLLEALLVRAGCTPSARDWLLNATNKPSQVLPKFYPKLIAVLARASSVRCTAAAALIKVHKCPLTRGGKFMRKWETFSF